MGPLIPLFRTSGDVCPGFQSQGGLACMLSCLALFLRYTSGATPADLLMASMVAKPLWPTYLQPSDVSTSIGGVEVGAAARTYGLGKGSNPRPTVPQHSELNHSSFLEVTGKIVVLESWCFTAKAQFLERANLLLRSNNFIQRFQNVTFRLRRFSSGRLYHTVEQMNMNAETVNPYTLPLFRSYTGLRIRNPGLW